MLQMRVQVAMHRSSSAKRWLASALPQHAGEHVGVEIAHVQRGFTAAHNGSHNAGKSLDGTHRCNRVRMAHGDGPNLKRKLRRGRQGVMPHGHRRRAGVRLLPIESDRMTLHTFRAQHDAQRQLHALQHWALLDVELKIRSRILLLRCAVRYVVDGDAGIEQACSSVMPSLSLRTRSAARLCVPANADEPKRLRPNRAPSSSAQSTSSDRHRRLATVVLADRAHHFQRGQHAEAAIEPSSIGHGIEMAAQQQGALAACRAA